jgi:hypothetical protein
MTNCSKKLLASQKCCRVLLNFLLIAEARTNTTLEARNATTRGQYAIAEQGESAAQNLI